MSADKSLAPGGAQCETIFIAVEWQHPFHCGNLGFNLNELLFRLIIVSMSATAAAQGSECRIHNPDAAEMRCIGN